MKVELKKEFRFEIELESRGIIHEDHMKKMIELWWQMVNPVVEEVDIPTKLYNDKGTLDIYFEGEPKDEYSKDMLKNLWAAIDIDAEPEVNFIHNNKFRMRNELV